jgi:hypothetical protein
MKRICLVFCFFFALSAAVFAQTPPTPKPLVVPKVSSEVQAHFFKALSQLQTAQQNVEQAQKALQDKQAAWQAAVQAVNAACGDDFTAQLDKDGDPECLAKPAPPSSPVAPKK